MILEVGKYITIGGPHARTLPYGIGSHCSWLEMIPLLGKGGVTRDGDFFMFVNHFTITNHYIKKEL